MKKFCTFLVTFFVVSCSFNIVNAQIVSIPDANLAAGVRKQLNIPSGGPISRQAMQHLMLLYARNTEIKNLTGLEYATQLEVLDLRDNAVTDVSSLAKLKNLRRLKLSGNAIVDVSPLAGLENLRWLDLKNNAIIDISPLTTLKNTSLSLNDNPITVNFPLITNSMVLETGAFIVLSRNQNHSIQKGKVKIIYPDWQAFIDANPVVLRRSGVGRTISAELRTLSSRINQTLDSFRSDGQGGTIELIAHPKTKAEFGDLIISEIMWGRHETPSDNQWIELYSPKKRITLENNRFALLFTGTYLDREVIPSTQPYAGWKVIDRVQNAGSQENLSWSLPERSSGLQPSEFPVSMYRVIDYATGTVPDGSLATSWMASDVRENFLSTSYGSPGTRGETKVHITKSKHPTIYWVNTELGILQYLAGDQVENVEVNFQNVTGFAVDTVGEKNYWTAKTTRTAGKIYRANFDGSEVEELKSLPSIPLSISVDSKGGKLYWTTSRGVIQRSNLKGKAVKNLIQKLDSPKTITLDVAGGKLYWTQQGSIWHADLNGERAEELVTGVREIGGIAVAGSHIYWTEQVKADIGVVKRANLDGRYPKKLISAEDVFLKGIAVDGVGEKLYYGDSRGRIRSANLNGSQIQNVVTGLGTPTHLALNVLVPEVPKKSVKIRVPAAQRPPMYWVSPKSGKLQRLVGTEVETIAPSVRNGTSVAVDTTNGKIYFIRKTSDETGEIHRVNLDGSNLEMIASPRAGIPLDLAIDPANRKLYWTDSRGRIRRANLNGKSVKNLIQNLNSPEAIALDVGGGKIYYAEPDSLWRANLNGRNREELVTDLATLGRITIVNGKIYWTEKVNAEMGAIKRANLDGTNVEEFVSIQGIPFGMAVDSVGGKLYWTNSSGKIQRANLKRPKVQAVVTGLDMPGDFTLGIEQPVVPAAPQYPLSGSTNPETTQLFANYPNPFNPETWIPYDLAEDTDVHIHIYSLKGELVRQLSLGFQTAGTYRTSSRAAYWDGRNAAGEPVASGIYFYTLQVGHLKATRRMVILK